MNAHEEVLKVEVSTEWLKYTLEHSGSLLLLCFLEIILGLFADEYLSSHGSALESKILPVFGLVILDGSTHSRSDVFSIMPDIFTDVPGEGFWALEHLGDQLEFVPVSLGA